MNDSYNSNHALTVSVAQKVSNFSTSTLILDVNKTNSNNNIEIASNEILLHIINFSSNNPVSKNKEDVIDSSTTMNNLKFTKKQTEIEYLVSTTAVQNEENKIQGNELFEEVSNDLSKNLNLNLNLIISTSTTNLQGAPQPMPNRCRFKRSV